MSIDIYSLVHLALPRNSSCIALTITFKGLVLSPVPVYQFIDRDLVPSREYVIDTGLAGIIGHVEIDPRCKLTHAEAARTCGSMRVELGATHARDLNHMSLLASSDFD